MRSLRGDAGERLISLMGGERKWAGSGSNQMGGQGVKEAEVKV